MLKDFKTFIMRGNVIDLAVGVIIGIAFGAVVTSLVNDVMMPPIGRALGGLDFKDLFISLDGKTYGSLQQARAASAPVIAYGAFVNATINFLIVAFAVFLVVRQVNRFKRPAAAESVAMKECAFCGMKIPAQAIRCPQCTSDLKLAG